MRLSLPNGLFTAKTQPHQVDRPANSHEQADQGEDSIIEPLIQGVSDATPENQAGEEVAKDGPHCILFTAGHGDSLLPRVVNLLVLVGLG